MVLGPKLKLKIFNCFETIYMYLASHTTSHFCMSNKASVTLHCEIIVGHGCSICFDEQSLARKPTNTTVFFYIEIMGVASEHETYMVLSLFL